MNYTFSPLKQHLYHSKSTVTFSSKNLVKLCTWTNTKLFSTSQVNLSNALEYFSEEGSDSFLEKLADKMVKGGRICSWNIIIPRSAASNLGHKFKALNQLANTLHKKDKFFYYKALHVDECLWNPWLGLRGEGGGGGGSAVNDNEMKFGEVVENR